MNDPSPKSTSPPELLQLGQEAVAAAAGYVEQVHQCIALLIAPKGRVLAELLEQYQFAAHGFAWIAAYVEALKQFLDWAQRLQRSGEFGDLEQLMFHAGFGEYLAQLGHGIAMNQDEVVRPMHLRSDAAAQSLLATPAVRALIASGCSNEIRMQIVAQVNDTAGLSFFGNAGLSDTLVMVRDQFKRFADEQIAPHASQWHGDNVLIPLEIIEQLGRLGVFGMTVASEYGGLASGKIAMCVVTEELTRGYIGVGSLGTRSEIAAELIGLGGTPGQKQRYLPKLASGQMIPTAVFSEPDFGSDLAHIQTRAIRDGNVYRVYGNKTWITHGARSDLMALLARTDVDATGYRGLSMFLAEKPRGTEGDPFPAPGMSGSEIEVLGYRGMKEYEISFDGFEISAEGLLGGVESQGFKQLMATMETARIQTASRSIGVAQNALELALCYARERIQFGKPILEFPRIAQKVAWMAVETMLVRQLVYHAARTRDRQQRSDIEASMAKLLSARVAWSNADNAVQVHGGNGYAEEFPISRVLCDARILSIFEGSSEIQAQIIARGLIAESSDL